MDRDRTGAALRDLRRQLLETPKNPEWTIAWSRLLDLEQAFYRVHVLDKTARVQNSNVKADDATVLDKAKSALLEMGCTTRHATAIVSHLVNRGVIS